MRPASRRRQQSPLPRFAFGQFGPRHQRHVDFLQQQFARQRLQLRNAFEVQSAIGALEVIEISAAQIFQIRRRREGRHLDHLRDVVDDLVAAHHIAVDVALVALMSTPPLRLVVSVMVGSWKDYNRLRKQRIESV